jgi:biopolymer transport protein ExbB
MPQSVCRSCLVPFSFIRSIWVLALHFAAIGGGWLAPAEYGAMGRLAIGPAAAYAQEGDEEEPAAEGDADAAPVADVAAGGEADEEADAAADADAAAGEDSELPKNRFWWIIESSGLIGLFILILSIYFVAKVIQLFIELRPQVAMPPEEVAQCENLLAARDYQGIYDFTSRSSSLYSRMVSGGVAELPNGIEDAREVVEGLSEVETVDMERKISMLAVLGTLGPMIGLVGTLKGMISSFAVIALTDQQLKPSQVAGGISEALILTFEGVALAVPAIFFYAFFRNRVAKISVETMIQAESFLRRLVQQAKKGGMGPPPGQTAPGQTAPGHTAPPPAAPARS